jgi:putative inorganic carbon (HCO3(-)) transporter
MGTLASRVRPAVLGGTAAVGAAVVVGGVLVGAGSVLLAYRTSTWVPLVLLAGSSVVVVVLTRPMLSLHLAIALVPLELFSFIKIGTGGISPSEAMFGLTGLGWAANRLAERQPLFVRAPLSWPLGVLVLAIVPGLTFAPELYPVTRMLLMWALFFLIYEMVVADGRVETVKSLLMVLALSAGVVGVIAAVQSGGGTLVELQGVGQSATGRAQGSFGHPNTLATFEGLAVPGALVLTFIGPRSWRPFALAAALLAVGGVALSLSRGGLLAIAGALGVLLLWAPIRRTALVLTAVVVVFAVTGTAGFGDLQQTQVLTERLSSIRYSAQGVDPRFIVWRGTPQIIEDHPIFGVGGNSFSLIAPSYGLLLGPAAEDTFEHAHDIALTITAELGVVGLAALTWVTLTLLRLLLRTWRFAEQAERGLVLAIAAAYAALALQGVVDYTLRSNVIAAVVFMMGGAVTVLWRHVDPAADQGGQPEASSA